MAEEPQPPAVEEGLPTPKPTSAEDRKAAAALDSLDARGPAEDTSSAPKKEVDVKALTDAMKNLETSSTSSARKPNAALEAKRKEAEEVKKIKVDAADVSLVMEWCDLNKVKATELLRGHGADVGKALKGYVTTGVTV